MNGNFATWGTAGRSIAEFQDTASTSMLVETADLQATIYSSADNNNPTKWQDYVDKTTSLKGNSDWSWQPPSNFDGTVTTYYTTNDGSGNNKRRPVARHLDGVNVNYLDGHVKWLRADRFVGPMPAGWPYGDPNNSWDNK
jgi:prepilin-type processing-associated H-X9-DG protein